MRSWLLCWQPLQAIRKMFVKRSSTALIFLWSSDTRSTLRGTAHPQRAQRARLEPTSRRCAVSSVRCTRVVLASRSMGSSRNRCWLPKGHSNPCRISSPHRTLWRTPSWPFSMRPLHITCAVRGRTRFGPKISNSLSTNWMMMTSMRSKSSTRRCRQSRGRSKTGRLTPAAGSSPRSYELGVSCKVATLFAVQQIRRHLLRVQIS
mmetsp:Transcript_67267/g.174305  ORF Transcript_67267/g.174305 Transcript_67267/m.174305 type:complete len:205 (+) Transcript_67267:852-1466(+)